MALDVDLLVARLRSVLGDGSGVIALHEPRFAGREWDYVKNCLDTGWVSYGGKFVGRFEDELATRCRVKYAVAVVNGTVALQMALLLAGVRPGDEVLVPALTFVATANAVNHCGAIPHLVDSENSTLGLDPEKLSRHLTAIAAPGRDGCINGATGRRIAAIVPMHVFGHPVDMEALLAVADRYALPVVEDAAEGLGSHYKGKPLGGLGLLGALSFNGNKTVTTGGGGAILTNSTELAERARHLTTTAKRPHRWEFDHDCVGYNFRMPNVNAAIGLAQLEQLDGFIAAKRRLAARYAAAFEHFEGASFIREPEFAVSNYWLNALLLDDDDTSARDRVLAATNDNGIMTRPVWRLMHRLPMFENVPRMDLTRAENLARRVISIPSSAILGERIAA